MSVSICLSVSVCLCLSLSLSISLSVSLTLSLLSDCLFVSLLPPPLSLPLSLNVTSAHVCVPQSRTPSFPALPFQFCTRFVTAVFQSLLLQIVAVFRKWATEGHNTSQRLLGNPGRGHADVTGVWKFKSTTTTTKTTTTKEAEDEKEGKAVAPAE